MDIEILGEILKERRQTLRLSQEQLSKKSGVAIKTIHGIELGKGNPGLNTLNHLLQTLQLDLLIIASKTK